MTQIYYNKYLGYIALLFQSLDFHHHLSHSHHDNDYMTIDNDI